MIPLPLFFGVIFLTVLLCAVVLRSAQRSKLQPVAQAEPLSVPSGGEGSYRLVLVNCGPNKIKVIKVLREVTGATLTQAKRFADQPGMTIERLDGTVARAFMAKLQEAGAVVQLQDGAKPVDPSTPATSPAPASGGCELQLLDPGPNRIAVIHALHEATGIELHDAKVVLVSGRLAFAHLDDATAEHLKTTLEAAGATVSIVSNGA